ncbi:hypothetical protein [Gordonia sp. OPL2]|uniref:hypothetical protein n=1 Tax=Gordonia sp. OPL2 TaxID=2486274 RepID=UPI0016566369|nr:hypothetical protein [Gordonia sp. OPL2]RPA19973.1 hypothetical protein EEB19_02760 [Gordonia sp. OPL2]
MIRAVVAGTMVAVGIGLGAFNAWWVAVVIGVPLIVAGIAVLPRPSRISELPEFRRGTSADAVPIEVEAITRSSLDAGEMQPTMVTATVRPPDDTAYRGRWISSMSRSHFHSVVDRPFTTVPAGALPDRSPGQTPEFGDQPGRWALVYPAAAVVAATVLLLGVPGSVWDIDVSMPSVSGLSGDGGASGSEDPAVDLDDRKRSVLDEIAQLGPTASANILSLDLDEDDTTRAEVYDPTTGEAITLSNYSGRGWDEPRRGTTTKRRADTFRADEIAGTDLGSLTTTMGSRIQATRPGLTYVDMTISRPARGEPVLLVGAFGQDRMSDVEIQGRPDGQVAEFFDPGDFATSFRLARDALAGADLATDQPNLRRFEIRGTADNTPIMYAGQIQNSGGVLMEFTSPDRHGTLTVVPGEFPALSDYQGRSSAGDFSFDQVRPAVFESVRAQAMERGAIEPFDRSAVDIEATSIFAHDDEPVVKVELARESASAGTYSMTGQFLETGY